VQAIQLGGLLFLKTFQYEIRGVDEAIDTVLYAGGLFGLQLGRGAALGHAHVPALVGERKDHLLEFGPLRLHLQKLGKLRVDFGLLRQITHSM